MSKACPWSYNTKLFCMYACSDMFHACAICHITELATGSRTPGKMSAANIQSLLCGWFGLYVCVGGCVHRCWEYILWHASAYVWVGRCVGVCGSLWEVYMVDNQIKWVVFHIDFHGRQVNKQIMFKEAWSLNAHTCIHRYCCVGPSVPLAERVNPCMESQATWPL